jgi:hypothetical protein
MILPTNVEASALNSGSRQTIELDSYHALESNPRRARACCVNPGCLAWNLSISLKSMDRHRPSAETHFRNSNTFQAAATKRSVSVRSAAVVNRSVSGVQTEIVALARRSACVITAEVHWTNPSRAKNFSSARVINNFFVRNAQ